MFLVFIIVKKWSFFFWNILWYFSFCSFCFLNRLSWRNMQMTIQSWPSLVLLLYAGRRRQARYECFCRAVRNKHMWLSKILLIWFAYLSLSLVNCYNSKTDMEKNMLWDVLLSPFLPDFFFFMLDLWFAVVVEIEVGFWCH